VARLGFPADFLSRTVLVGFLTGVGIQVAAGQVGGMLGIPKPASGLPFFSGDLIELLKTLGHVGQASWQTALVSASVLAVLIVFERWIKAIPGGLVAVVGAIVASWALNLQSHGVSILGPVPSGLPSIGLPSGVTWQDITKCCRPRSRCFCSRTTGSLSRRSSETQATRPALRSAHWASSVVLPYPEGAATQISLVGVASSRSSRAVLGTMRWVGGGGWSLDSRSSNDRGQQARDAGYRRILRPVPSHRPRGKATSGGSSSQHRTGARIVPAG
jgi:Sulfate permease family